MDGSDVEWEFGAVGTGMVFCADAMLFVCCGLGAQSRGYGAELSVRGLPRTETAVLRSVLLLAQPAMKRSTRIA